MEALEKQLEELLVEIEQSTNELAANKCISPTTLHGNQLVSEDLDPSKLTQKQENSELNIEAENNDKNGKLPNTDDLLDIKVIKTSLLGKAQAKKRLQAFYQTKKLDVKSKVLGIQDVEKSDEKQVINKKPKKCIHPSEKAKTVIEEIEEIKMIESAYHEALEQQILFNKHDKWKSDVSKSRSRSRDRNKKRDKKEHKRSRSRDRYRKIKIPKIEKLKYPNSWKELKENNFELEKLSTIFPIESKIDENKVYDFRKQLLFIAPSCLLQRFVAYSTNGESITFPAEYIRFTTSNPSVPYCVNLQMSHDLFDRKCVHNYVPEHFKTILEQFINVSKRHCKPKPPLNATSRKWYPKESTACTLLETSLGLTFLQNYSDDDEQEKDENYNEDDIDSDGVIAEILEDIHNTQLLLIKNSEHVSQDIVVVDESQSATEFDKHIPKNKRKKKEKKRSKSKKKKSKIAKKHKVKKEKKKIATALNIEQDRSRSKSDETNLPNKLSIKHKKHDKHDTSKSKQKSEMLPIKNQIVSEEKDHVIKNKKESKSKKHSSKSKEPNIEIPKKADSTTNQKKRRDSSKHENKVKIQNENHKTDSYKDGRTSVELKMIIKEKQKILNEHSWEEVDEYDKKNEIIEIIDNKDDNYRKRAKNIKLEMNHDATKDFEKTKHKKCAKELSREGTCKEKSSKISSKHERIEESDDCQEILLPKRNKKSEKGEKLNTFNQKIESETPNKKKCSSYDSNEKNKIYSKHKKVDKCHIADQGNLSTNPNKAKISCIDDQKTLSLLKDDLGIKKDSSAKQAVTDGTYSLDELAIIDTTDQVCDGEFKKENNKKQRSNIYEENLSKTDLLKSDKKKIEETGRSKNKDSDATHCGSIKNMLVDDTKEQIQKNADCSHSKSKEDNASNNIVDQLYSPKATYVNKTDTEATISEEMLNKKQEELIIDLTDSKTTEIETGKESGTPNTEEYFSEWESNLDVENTLTPHKLSRSWESEEDLLHKYVNKSRPHNSRESSLDKNRFVKARHTSFSLETTYVQKDTLRRPLEERRKRRSFDYSPEKFLEMPFNINNVKRERNNWREERPSFRNLHDRSPDRVQMDFHLQSDKSYSKATGDSWETEMFSIKTEELRLEQERLSLLEERRKLEIERQKFEELEKQRHQARIATEERQRKQKRKDDRNQSQRDYDQFNLNEFTEASRNENTFKRARRNRWDDPNKDVNSKIEPTLPEENKFRTLTFKSALKLSVEHANVTKDLKKPERKSHERDKKNNFASENISKPKPLKSVSKSPEKLENEYEKFLEMLDPKVGKNKLSKKINVSKTKNKNYSISSKIKASKSAFRKRSKKPVVSSSSSSSWSSSSDSDSTSYSSSSSSSSSTSTTASSTSSSSYNRHKKSKKRVSKTKKDFPPIKSITTSSTSMKTKAIQVIKNEIVKTVGTNIKPAKQGTSITIHSSSEDISEPVPLVSIVPDVPLPVPSPKVNSSNADRLPYVCDETNSASNTLSKTQVVNNSISELEQDAQALHLFKISLKSKCDADDVVADSKMSKMTENDSDINILCGKSFNKNDLNSDQHALNDSVEFEPITSIKEDVQDISCSSSRSSNRRRDDYSRSRWNSIESPQRTKRHSLSPTQPDVFRSKERLCKRNDYSPQRREISPRRKDYSPRRKSLSPSRDYRKEPIQEVLQRLAGMDNYYPRKKSPVGSPVHGFKRSVADSTISDEQLLQYRVEEHTESQKFLNTSSLGGPPVSKRISLDQRITQELGISVRPQKIVSTTSYLDNYQYTQESQQYYDHYNQQYNETSSKNNYRDNSRRGINQNVLQPVPIEDYSFKTKPPPPLQQNEITNTTQQIKQVGNILEIIPTESVEKPEIPRSSAFSTVQSVFPETKHALSATTAVTASTVTSTTKVTSPTAITSTIANDSAFILTPTSPVSQIEFSPASSTTPNFLPSNKNLNAEALIKQKIERRAEKDKRKQERELKREEKEKKKKVRDNIKLRESNAITESIVLEALSLDNEDNCSNFQWPVPKVIFNSSHTPPEKGILLKSKRGLEPSNNLNDTPTKLKNVKFSDGVFPGEGTSPSGGEELSSPPPTPKKLPKERSYKKTKAPKAPKVPKRKKVKVKVVRHAEEEDEEDDLPPPPPPIGSPPPHIFPARIKTIINNIHPTIAVSIANSMLQPESPVFRPPGFNVMAHQRSSLLQPAAQHHLGTFGSSIVSPAGAGLTQVSLSVPPPTLSSHHHVGHNNLQPSPYTGHHHH